MLRLPEQIQACLFDLDGVLTEDTLAGVEAGRAGQAEALRAHGADVVVADQAELLD